MMRFLLPILLFFLVGLEESVQGVEITTWEQFKETFGKTYSSVEEELARKSNFLRALAWINENHGKNGMEFGINEFADLSNDEFNSQFSLRVNHSQLVSTSQPIAHDSEPVDLYETLPVTFDWRTHMPINKIEHQGACGSCWAFASAFTIEAQYAIKQQRILHLSKQELIDCTLDTYDHEYKNHGCASGFAAETFKYVIKHGVQEAAYYTYAGHETQCRTKTVQSMQRYHINEFHQMAYNVSDTAVMSIIKNTGPVTALVYSSDNAFKYLKGGSIMRDLFPNDKRVNHMISLVGWSRSAEGVDYWIIRNSWGETWGDHGYAYLERHHNLLGVNFFVIYPVLH